VPFVGSGSECVAAIEAGRRYVGVEINPAYVTIARSRVKHASPKLFQVSAQKVGG
jgi:site-specific DNA-methyltransferase (adenine-specific)